MIAFALGVLLHGDLHEQIEAVTKQIEKEPGRADLYFKRGELRRFHEELKPAREDLDRAAELDPKLAVVDLARARLEQALGDPKAAIEAVDRFLAKEPGHGEARVVRARALAKRGDHAAAAEEYSRALAKLPEPRPEHYLERAQSLAALDRIDEAVRGLEEGMRKLGPIITLQLGALDLETRAKKYDAALDRLARIQADSPRKDPWLARRGDLLREAGRPREAREAYRAALAAMETLIPRQRQAKATVELEDRCRAALEELPE